MRRTCRPRGGREAGLGQGSGAGEVRRCWREGKASAEVGEGEAEGKKGAEDRRAVGVSTFKVDLRGSRATWVGWKGWRQSRGRGKTVSQRLRERELEEKEGRMR